MCPKCRQTQAFWSADKRNGREAVENRTSQRPSTSGHSPARGRFGLVLPRTFVFCVILSNRLFLSILNFILILNSCVRVEKHEHFFPHFFINILKYILKRIAYNKCIINDTLIDMNFNNLRQCQVTYEKMSQKKKGVSDSDYIIEPFIVLDYDCFSCCDRIYKIDTDKIRYAKI